MSAAANHTDGPWRVDNSTAVIGARVMAPAARGISVAWCGQSFTAGADGSYSLDATEAAANARLIAAAPELLAALRACARLVLMSDGANAPAYQQAMAAIRKVEGKE